MSTVRVFLAIYSVALLWLLPKLSLWLDEILDMMGSTKPLPEVIRWAAINPGGVPLGYIVHWTSFQTFGVSAFSARLPSAIASVAACIGIYVVSKRAGLRAPILAVVVFALLPIQFRYALEARPYAIALAISVWIVALFDQILEKPTTARLVIFGLLAACGLYAQPNSVFILAAQGIFVLACRRDILTPVALALGLAGAAFGAWFVYARAWSTPLSIVEGQQATGWRSLGLVAHEITGMGYAGTILAGVGIGAGLRTVSRRGLWWLYLLVPIVGAIAFDVGFGYFLAIRQMIYAIIAMTVLFAYGVESLAPRFPRHAAALLAAMLAGSFYADLKMFTRPRENWKAASAELEAEAGKGACLVFVPANFEIYYTFFSPGLSGAKCSTGEPIQASSVAIAVGPGDHAAELEGWSRQLNASGFTSRAGPTSNPPYVRVFSTR